MDGLAARRQTDGARARGTQRKLVGAYQHWKSVVEDAVSTKAPPSPDLILANEYLADWESHLGIGEVSSFPVSVQLELNDLCNARCSFCSYELHKSQGRQVEVENLERADWLKFCRRIDPNVGLNEPLAHPRIADVFAAVRRQAPFITMGMQTNASLLTEKIIETITSHMSKIYVSMNATRRESYEAVMPPLKWDRLIENLSRLRDEKARRGTHLPVVIASFVAHRGNLRELTEAPALLKQLGIDQLRIQIMTVQKPIASRSLMTMKETVQTVPKLANWAFRTLERESARHGVTIVHKLPRFEVEDARPAIPLPCLPLPRAPPARDPLRAFVDAEVDRAAFATEDDFASDDDFASHEGLASAPRTTAPVSREWLDVVGRGETPFCGSPWRHLKINLLGRTKICCTFFTKLPTFEWPDARGFHDAAGLWNHPFLKHLRQTMGTEEEVPYCTLCTTTDKRHPANKAALRDATKTSLELYQRLDSARPLTSAPGPIDRIEGSLENWSVTGSKRGDLVRPFRHDKHHYRGILQVAGFRGGGALLQAGSNDRAISPFLAEKHDELVLLDFKLSRADAARTLCSELGLENVRTHQAEDAERLPFDDGSFAAAWVKGNWLSLGSRSRILKEFGRCLKPGGLVHFHLCDGVGALIETADRGEADGTDLWAIIEKGPLYDGTGNYMSSNAFKKILTESVLELDDASKPQISFCDPALVARVAVSKKGLMAKIAGQGAKGPLEKKISFSCRRLPL